VQEPSSAFLECHFPKALEKNRIHRGYVKNLDKCPSVFGRHLIFVMNIPHRKWGRQKPTPTP
jgi:hypothetical protein